MLFGACAIQYMILIIMNESNQGEIRETKSIFSVKVFATDNFLHQILFEGRALIFTMKYPFIDTV